MFLAIGGAGLVLALAGIAWMVVSYLKSKSFVFPAVLFLLGFAVMGGGIYLEAVGGLPGLLGGPDPAADVQQASPDPAAGEPIGSEEPPSLSLDALCALIDVTLSGNCSGKEVTHDGSTVTVNLWMDGLAGSLSHRESWESDKANAQELAASLQELAVACGQGDAALALHVLDGADHDAALLSFLNGEISYEAQAAEPEPPQERVSHATTTPEKSEPPKEEPPPANEPGEQTADEPISIGPQLPPTETSNTVQDGNDGGSVAGPQLPPDGGTSDTALPSPDTGGTGDGSSSGGSPHSQWRAGCLLASDASDKYHSGDCMAAQNILYENEIWFVSEEEAQANGYTRCGICYK